MKAKVQFIGAMAMINAYLMAFAYGFNSHPVLVVDPSLPPLAVEKTKLPQPQPPNTAGEAHTTKNEAKRRSRSKESARAEKSSQASKADKAAKADKPKEKKASTAKTGKAKPKKGSSQAD